MSSTSTDRIDGINTSVAVKAPCVVATIANITLSGTQTIDGVAVVADNRVLVKNQTTTTENGIYKVSSTAWTRAKDFDGDRDIVRGTRVYVFAGGTQTAGDYILTTVNPTIGTSNLAFSKIAGGGGTGDITGPGSSTDNELVLFSGAAGDSIKSATGTGYVKVISGVMSAPSPSIPNTDITGLGTGATADASTFMLKANNLGDVASASTARSNLGLGTIATQAASNITITGGSITGMSTPSASSDVATKGYADGLAQGLAPKAACRVATTAALTATYANGSSGVGATLTNSSTQAALSIDGVSLSANDRVLVKNQSSTFQDGIYTVTTVGSGSTNWVLTRATDFDIAAEMLRGAWTLVTAGTTNGSHQFFQSSTTPSTVGTDAVTFTDLGAIFLAAANNLSDLANIATARSNLSSLNTIAASGGSQTLDFSTYNVIDITLTASCIFSFTLPSVASGKFNEYLLILRQNGTGGWSPTWPSNGTTTIWSGTASSSTPPAINTNANSITVIRLKQVAGVSAVIATVEGTNVGNTVGNVAVAGLYLAGGAGMKANKSSDGSTFSAANPSFAGGTFDVIDIVYSTVNSKFILLGKPAANTTAANAIQNTTNGSSYSSPSGGGNDVPASAINKLFEFSNGNIITSQPGTGTGSVTFSSDGGATFAAKTVTGSSTPNIASGWIGAANSALIVLDGSGNASYTTDGGVSISTITHTGVTDAKGAVYLNGNYIVGGATGNIGYKTLVSATALTTISSNLASANFLGGAYDGTGYVLFTGQSLSTATSMGGTWTSRTTAFFTTAGMTGNIVGMAVTSGNVIVAATDTGDVARSTDHGVTWTKISAGNNFMSGTQIRFIKTANSNVWLGSDTGKLGYTSDGLAITAITTTGFSTNAVLAFAAG